MANAVMKILRGGLGRTPTLTGGDTYASLDPTPPADMIRVATYKACSPMHAKFLGARSPKLHLFARQSIADTYFRGRMQAAGYLRLGLWRSHIVQNTVVLLGGSNDKNGTNLVIMVFRQGELKDVSERFLPPDNAIDYDDLIDTTLQGLMDRHTGCEIEQCAPLPRWKHPAIKAYHQSSLFLRWLPTAMLKKKTGGMPAWVVPVAALALSAAYYGVMVSKAYFEYTHLTGRAEVLREEMTALGTRGVDIATLEARNDFMHAQARMTAESTVAYVRQLASAVQDVPNAILEHITTRPREEENNLLALLRVTVPVEGAYSAILQGREILSRLSETSGFSMRLAQGNIHSQGNTRTFVIEVFHE